MSDPHWTASERAEIALLDLMLDAKRRLLRGEISADDCEVISQQIRAAGNYVRVIALMLPPRTLRPREFAQ
jgi:hypothetical protein